MRVVYDYLSGASPWYSCAKSRKVWVWTPQQEQWIQQQDPTPDLPISPEASGLDGLRRFNVEIPMTSVRVSRLEAELSNLARWLPPLVRFRNQGAFYVALGVEHSPWIDFGVWYDAREPYGLIGHVPQRLQELLPQDIPL